MLPYLQMHRITFTSLLVISLQHLCQYHQKGFLTNKDYSLSQNIKVELESVQEELSSTRKDKFMLQAKVGELRNSMKTVLLQNQQLKQDLKQSRLRKVGHLICPCEKLLCPVLVLVLFLKNLPAMAPILGEKLNICTNLNVFLFFNLHLLICHHFNIYNEPVLAVLGL